MWLLLDDVSVVAIWPCAVYRLTVGEGSIQCSKCLH